MGNIWRECDKNSGKRMSMKLINIIAEYMITNKISFNSLAKKMMMTRCSVSEMFSGNHVWSLSTLIKVCDALEFNVDIILTPRKLTL